MTNLSASDLKKLGISEDEMNQYKGKLLNLALSVAGDRGCFIGKSEFLKPDKDSRKLYQPQMPEAIKLIRQLEKQNSFDENKVRKELENRLEKIEKRPKMRIRK